MNPCSKKEVSLTVYVNKWATHLSQDSQIDLLAL